MEGLSPLLGCSGGYSVPGNMAGAESIRIPSSSGYRRFFPMTVLDMFGFRSGSASSR
jgi:hypothetical protein